ncbi:MAG: hypothetical protein QM817_12535 [Archangium sp.]
MSTASSRFPLDADDEAEARRYLENRAVQAVMDGWKFEREMERTEWGLAARALSPEGEWHQTFYILKRHRSRGLVAPFLKARALPVVTTRDCDLEGFLSRKGLAFRTICTFSETPEYRAIAAHYGNTCAERSQLPYMNHIDEGLAVLRVIGASDAAKRAFCLHPLVQADADLLANLSRVDAIDGVRASNWLLAAEYRRIANLTLSHRDIASAADIPLGPLTDVHDMLRADKIQNEKDFLAAHSQTHERRVELARYFTLWLERLGVSAELRMRCHAAMQPFSPLVCTKPFISAG